MISLWLCVSLKELGHFFLIITQTNRSFSNLIYQSLTSKMFKTLGQKYWSSHQSLLVDDMASGTKMNKIDVINNHHNDHHHHNQRIDRRSRCQHECFSTRIKMSTFIHHYPLIIIFLLLVVASNVGKFTTILTIVYIE